MEVLTFEYPSRIVKDADGHQHPGAEHADQMNVVRIGTRAGAEGFCFASSVAGVEAARSILVGRDAFAHEGIWADLRRAQRIHRGFTDTALGVVDQAIWDLVGRALDQPVCNLIGRSRDRVPAYASTMCGDDQPGGLDSPEAYAEFALSCKAEGYRGLKLHTWMRPFEPSVLRDIEACRAVREAVGSEMTLMLDPYHDYTREEALRLGRALEELNFHWLEEPMNEHSISSYVWLTDQLDILIVGPETAEGKMYTRAEWIIRGASDISRFDVWQGGLTAAIKTAHLCEAFGVRLEIHDRGAGNLQVLGAMPVPGEFYERGLLHPMVGYDDRTPWLKELVDPLDHQGHVKIPQSPGLGEIIDWDFVNHNIVSPWR